MKTSNDDLITPDEDEKLRKGAKTITVQDVMKKGIPIVKPLHLASGYDVSMSIDDPGQFGRRILHISVYHPKGQLDPADCEHIATAVLGDGYKTMNGLINSLHFLKFEEV